MLCPWCGAEVPETKYCENCGASLTSSDLERKPAEQQPGAIGAIDGATAGPELDFSEFESAIGAPPQGNAPAVPASQQPATAATPQQWQAAQPGMQTQLPFDPSSYQQPGGQQGHGAKPHAGQAPAQQAQQAQQQAQGESWSFPTDTQTQAPDQPVYGKTWFVVLMLFVFWPVGLGFMWTRSCTWSRAVKIAVSAFFAIIVLAEGCASLAVMNTVLDDPGIETALELIDDSDIEDALDLIDADDILGGGEDDLDDLDLGSAAANAAGARAFAGTWKLASMVEDGKELTTDDLKVLDEIGFEVTLTLDGSGEAELTLFDQVEEGTWQAKTPSIALLTIDDEDTLLTIVDNQLIIANGDNSIVFNKAD